MASPRTRKPWRAYSSMAASDLAANTLVQWLDLPIAQAVRAKLKHFARRAFDKGDPAIQLRLRLPPM